MTAALRTWCCSAAVSPVSRLHGAAPPLPPPLQPAPYKSRVCCRAELCAVTWLQCCSAAVLQAGLGPAIALSACLPRQSGLLSLKNVWTSSSSAPSCGAAVHRAAVLQCCRPNTQCRVWPTCLIVWYRLAAAALCTIEYYLTRLYPLRKSKAILQTKYYPSSCLPSFLCSLLSPPFT